MDGMESSRNDDVSLGPAPDRAVRIFVMDDSPVIRMGVHAMVGSAHGLEIVGSAHNGAVSPHDIQELAPDVIVVNSLSLSRKRLDQVRTVADRFGLSTRVLMIVGETESPASRQTKADGTVQIRARPDEFIAAIKLVAAGYSVAAPEPGPVDTDEPATAWAKTSDWNVIKLLTRRELDVLRAVAQGRTNAEIARLMTVSESTVKSHVQNMLAKLGLPNRASAVALAYETGMINDH